MKKIAKILSISLIAIMMMSTLCFAITEENVPTPSASKLDFGESFSVEKVLGVIQWIGIAIAVGMLIFLGIKYISKGVSEQAEIKKSLPIYILGVILIVGAPTLIKAIVKFM